MEEKITDNKGKIIVFYQGGYYSNGASAADRRVRDLVRGLYYAGGYVELHLPVWKKGQKDIPNSDAKEYKIVYLGKRNNKGKILKRIDYWYRFINYCKLRNVQTILFYGATPDLIIPSLLLKKVYKKVTMAEFCDSHSLSKHALMKKKSIILGEKILPKCTNINVVISDYLNNQTKRYAPNTPSIKIPILVDSDSFIINSTKLNEQSFNIAYVGGLWKDYGVDILLESYSKFLKITNNKNIKLTIAGRLDDTDKHTDVLGQIAKLGIGGNTEVTGWVTTDRVIHILNQANVVVVPHLNTPFCNAGLPTKLAEYAIMGKAIIITDVGDVKKYFSDKKDCLICEPNNVDSLSTCLESLYFNKDLTKRIGENAKKLALSMFDYKVNGLALMDKIKNYDTCN